MGIKHSAVKATGEKGYASEWNADHVVDDDVDFDSNKITNLGAPTENTDGATKKYVDDNIGGATALSQLAIDVAKDWQTYQIKNVGTPTLDQDAATKKYVDDTAGGAPVSSVFGRTGDVVATTNDYTWAQIDKTISDLANIATKSHTSLTDKGTNTHAQIDTHLASAANPHSVTYTQVGAIQNAADTVKDTHVDWGTGAGQVSADDVPDGITNKMLTNQAQTIAGVKTFSSFPLTPSSAPTTDYQTANKKYVDDAGAMVQHANEWHTPDMVSTTGNQSVAGTKTFTSFPFTPSAAPTSNYEVANKKYVDDAIVTKDKCRVYCEDWIGIQQNTETTISFPSETYDTNNIHEGAVNPSRLTIQKSGYYLIVASGGLIIQPGNSMELIVYKNGTDILSMGRSPYYLILAATTIAKTQDIHYLTSGSYIEMTLWHNASGGALLNPDPSVTYFEIVELL